MKRGALIACLLLGLLPRVVHAGACGQQWARFYPPPGATVPTNVAVRVLVHDTDLNLVDESARDHQALRDVSFSLVPKEGAPMALVTQLVTTRYDRALVLTHAAALTSGVVYTLVAHGVNRSTAGAPKHDYPLVSYTVGDTSSGPPVLIVKRARFGRFSRLGHYNDKGNEYGSFVLAELVPPGDAHPLLFEVTPVDERDRPLSAMFWKMPWRPGNPAGSLMFGSVGDCAHSDVEFAPHGRARFTVRGVDMAGHESAPVTLDVSLDHPFVQKH